MCWLQKCHSDFELQGVANGDLNSKMYQAIVSRLQVSQSDSPPTSSGGSRKSCWGAKEVWDAVDTSPDSGGQTHTHTHTRTHTRARTHAHTHTTV